jgi:uncharacterized protein with PIN domain
MHRAADGKRSAHGLLSMHATPVRAPRARTPVGSSPPEPREAEFRFYEELNDCLPAPLRKRSFSHRFRGTPAVKDVLEALGVPHTEIDLILVDGKSVRFGHKLRGGERVAVYPMFERFDITPIHRLRPRPLRNPRFVADVHLGKLARFLRLLGFDTRYRNDLDDADLVKISVRERRILLTRDLGLLKHKVLSRAHWVRATDAQAQLKEVVAALSLSRSCRPFTRCMNCNGALEPVPRAEIAAHVPGHVRRYFRRFARCRRCRRIYWRGTHFERLTRLVASTRRRLRHPNSADATAVSP